jgi:hypothetical protein
MPKGRKRSAREDQKALPMRTEGAMALPGDRSAAETKRSSIDFACLEAFVVAADHTSLAEAARSCGTNESTFGKRLKALEKWMGKELFVRSPVLSLTPAGRANLEDAVRVCLILKKMRQSMSFSDIFKEIALSPPRPIEFLAITV